MPASCAALPTPRDVGEMHAAGAGGRSWNSRERQNAVVFRGLEVEQGVTGSTVSLHLLEQ
jgi:hypothetical protein